MWRLSLLSVKAVVVWFSGGQPLLGWILFLLSSLLISMVLELTPATSQDAVKQAEAGTAKHEALSPSENVSASSSSVSS